MSRPPVRETDGVVVVDVAADPSVDGRADAEVHRRAWPWIVAVVVILAVGAGLLLWWQEAEPVFAPPRITGLVNEPTFGWQRELADIDETVTVLGDVIALHPSSWRGDELRIELLDPADGKPYWSEDFSEHVEFEPAVGVEVRDLPATPHIAVSLIRRLVEPQQILIVDRDTGAVVASHEMPAQSVLLSTDQGRYVLIQETDPFEVSGPTEVALLNSHDPADERWRTTDALPFLRTGRILLERGALIGSTQQWSGFHHSALEEVLTVEGGTRVTEVGMAGPAVFVGRNLVMTDAEGVVSLDTRTRQERWRLECRCMPYEMAGELFLAEWPDDELAFTRLEPESGAALWSEPLVMGPFWDMVSAGDDFVVFSIGNDDIGRPTSTCVQVLSVEAGSLGQAECGDFVYIQAWEGEGQIIVWDGATLAAVVVDGDRPGWRLELPSGSSQEIHDAAGRLVVIDETLRSVGVLE